MNQFVFSGDIPTMGKSYGLKAFDRRNGERLGGENGFDGGDAGLQYRFFNQAENNYSGSDIDKADSEILAEEAAFLGLENLFACRKQCKGDLGGASSLRQCIRNCKGKGLTKSALKTEDQKTQSKMAETLQILAAAPQQQPVAKSNTMLWVIVGIVVVIIVALIIYFATKKNEVAVTV